MDRQHVDSFSGLFLPFAPARPGRREGAQSFGAVIDASERSNAGADPRAGSQAQREVFEDTLIAACLGCGRVERARSLLSKRLARRPRAQDTTWRPRRRAINRVNDEGMRTARDAH